MTKDLHHIDDLFKKGLEGKEDHPSQQVWENIENELDQKKSKRPFLFFLKSKTIPAILLILLASAGLFAGGYFLRVFQMNDDKKVGNGPVIEKNIPRSGNSMDATSTERSSRTTEQNKVNKDHDADSRVDNKVPAASGSDNHSKASLSAKPSTNRDSNLPTSDRSGKKNPRNFSIDKKAVADTEKQARSSSDATPPLASAQNSAPPKKTSNLTLSTVQVPRSTLGRVNETARVDRGKNDRSIAGSQASTPSADIAASTPSADTAASTPLLDMARQMAAPPVGSNRDVAAEKRLLTSSRAFSNNEPASAIAIPVLNKKQGSVNLPGFSLTPVVALQFGSNRIKENTAYANSGKVKDEITRTESQPASIAGGILADLKINRSMTLQSGLVYTSRTIRIDPKNIIAERNPDGKVRYRFDCSAGTYFIKKAQGYTRPGDTAMTKFSTNDLNYLNIPLGLTYHFGGSTWHLFVMAGTGLNVLTRQYLKTGLKYGYYEEADTKVTNLENSYFNGSLGAGIIWSPFKKISFNLSPQYQFALSPMNTNMPVKAYPRIFNMQTGMQIRL